MWLLQLHWQQGNGGDECQQRRVLRIQAVVPCLPVLIAGIEMSTLIDRLRESCNGKPQLAGENEEEPGYGRDVERLRAQECAWSTSHMHSKGGMSQRFGEWTLIEFREE